MRLRSIAPFAIPALALCGWLHARGVGALNGARLGVLDATVFPAAHAAPEPPRDKSADAILARNPFDSTTGSLLAAPAASASSDDELRPCEGVRVASIVASSDPDWSFAVLERKGERDPVLRRRGGEVLAVGLDRVLLEREGERCVARMFAPRSDATPATPAPAAATPRGIARVGAGEYAVDRSARDALIEGAADLMHSVMVAPEKMGDDVVGLRIVALKPGTSLEALGIRAGDVVVSVGGIPLTSPDRMLEACARLRTLEHIRVDLVRAGRPTQLDYDVR
jgi:general secretion pathway protein C